MDFCKKCHRVLKNTKIKVYTGNAKDKEIITRDIKAKKCVNCGRVVIMEELKEDEKLMNVFDVEGGNNER